MDLAEFRDRGYLAEVNRQVLHPLGLALVLRCHGDGEVTFVGVLDCRDDAEGIYYLHPELTAVRTAHIRTETMRRRPAREAALGYWVQPLVPDAGE